MPLPLAKEDIMVYPNARLSYKNFAHLVSSSYD